MEVRDLGIKVHEGIHATVPFFCSETKQLLNDLQKKGALSVDMELSVLYALANYYGLKASGVIRIGDLSQLRSLNFLSKQRLRLGNLMVRSYV